MTTRRPPSIVLLVVCSLALAVPAGAESLWQDNPETLSPDIQPGDLVTIQVSESAEATTENTREREKETEIGGQANAGAGGATIIHDIAEWIPLFGPTISGESEYESEREADAAGSLNTTMTVKVAEVQSNGTVKLRGERKVKIDDEIQTITFEGLARSKDIEADNTIDSNRIANARIFYEGRLGFANGEARGWIDSAYLSFKNLLFW